MDGNSPRVTSSQSGPHRNLHTLVVRHLQGGFRRPVAAHSLEGFRRLQEWREAQPQRPLVLDSGCGTGLSLSMLQERHPEALLAGIDRSHHRLRRTPLQSSASHNVLLLRGDCVDLWRLMVEAGWQLAAHYLFYPNPWPKPSQVGRRWHGHPVFPTLLALGGALELRTNWSIYREEFGIALKTAIPGAAVELFSPEDVVTQFEEKYVRSHHERFGLRVALVPVRKFSLSREARSWATCGFANPLK